MKGFAISDFKPLSDRGHLVAYLTVETPSGFVIRDCRLFKKNGKRWIGLPSRQYKKSDGSFAYAEIVRFASKEAYARFQDQAMQAVDALAAADTEETYGPR
jgi:DNA-binding cell septation regulator SpoVG